MRIASLDLAGIDPFEVLARNIPAARQHVGNWTLVVVGMPRGSCCSPATSIRRPTIPARVRGLLDHGCALAKTL